MKKLLIVLVSLGLAFGASAQKIVHGGGYVRGPRVIVGVGAGYPFYNPYGFGYYSPFGYPYSPYGPYGYRSYSRPSKLELQIQDIRLDYSDRIKSVKSDRELKGRQKRKVVRQLKNDRDRAIVDAKRDYYYNRSSRRAPANSDSNSSNNNNDNYNQ